MKFDLTLLQSNKPITKVYKTIKPESHGFATGNAQRMSLTLPEYVDLLTSLKTTQALTYGVAKNGKAHNRVTVKDDQAGINAGRIARSREHFAWPTGAGVWYIDVDGSYSDAQLERALATIYAAMPEISAAPHVVTRSSSHGITKDGITKSGGAHIYVLVDNAQQIPVLTQTLYTRLFNAGHGYHILSDSKISPAALERNLIDKSVCQPERIDYAAAPVIKHKSISRIPVKPLVFNADAGLLCTAQIAPLSASETTRYTDLARQSKERIKPELRKEKARILKAKPKAQRKDAHKAMKAVEGGKLTESVRIVLDDGRVVSVKTILKNKAAYHGAVCRDPLEPDYRDGATVAIIYSDQNDPVIYSQAHGGQTFTLGLGCFKTLMSEIRSAGGVLKADIQDAAEKAGFDAVDAKRIVLKQGMKKYKPLHQAAPAEKHFESFDACMDHLKVTGNNAVIQAQLGSGKTEAVNQLVTHYRSQGSPVFISTVLTALAKQNADRSSISDYQEAPEWIDACGSVSTTIHSAGLEKVETVLDAMLRFQSGLVVIDEANQVSDLLFNPDSSASNILPGTVRRKIIDKLWQCSRTPGIQIIALDGDVSLGVASFAQSFGLEVMRVSECRYPQPAVHLYPVIEADSMQSEPLDDQIKDSLTAGEKTVIASTSKNQAASLFAKYHSYVKPGDALLITSETKDTMEVQQFLADPEAGAKRYQLIVYSPVLSAGFSIVQTPVRLFAFTDFPTVSVNGFWQMMRRFRQPVGGVIHCSLGTMSQRATAAWVPESEIDYETVGLASAFYGSRTCDPLDTGQAAYLKQRNLTAQNFSEALFFHLLNSGVGVEVKRSSVLYSGTDSLKQHGKVNKELRKAQVMASEVIDDETAEALSFESGKPENAILLERYRIESGLMLTADDHTEAGNLPEALYDSVVEDQLLTRVKRDSIHRLYWAGFDFSDKDTTTFALRRTTDKQVKTLDSIVTDLPDCFNAADAVVIADKYRAQIHVRYDLMTKPPVKPRAKTKESVTAYRRKASAWLRNLLISWGYDIDAKKVDKEWVYTARKSALVERFSTRFESINCVTKEMAGTLGTTGLEVWTRSHNP